MRKRQGRKVPRMTARYAANVTSRERSSDGSWLTTESAANTGDAKVAALAMALDQAVGQFLDANKNPSRKVNEIDNRGSHFFLTLYWATHLASCDNAELSGLFAPIAKELADNEDVITNDLLQCQGTAVDIGGYYKPDFEKLDAAMRPSAVLNQILAKLNPDTKWW